jgi:hypothetical protein
MGTRLPLSALAAVVAVAAGAGRLAAADPSEPELKAEFVERFTRFVDWDDSALPADLKICVVGDSPITAPLDRIAKRQKIKDRNAKVAVVAAEAVTGCQLVVVGGSDRKQLRAVLSRTDRRPVLTITDAPGGAAAGAIINFYRDDKHVKFEINTDAAKVNGLKVRAKLLRLARVVTGKAVP